MCSCVVIFHACQKHILEIQEWSPEMITPLINATITIGDLIPERGTTEYDDNNLIHLAFRSDTVYVLPPDLLLNIMGLNLDTLVTLNQLAISAQDNPSIAPLIDLLGLEIPFPESQEVVGTLFSFINASIIEPLSFQFDEFSDADFNSGYLEIEITNNLPVAIEELEIDIVPVSGIEWNIYCSDLMPNEEFIQNIDLSGLSITSTSSIEFDVQTLVIENVGSDMVTLTPQTGFGVSISLNDVDVENITLPLGRDTVDVDLALFEDFDSGLKLENPTFTIKVDNPFELSGSIDGYVEAFAQDGINSQSLPIEVAISTASEVLLNSDLNTKTYKDDDIDHIIELPPNTLEYESSVSMKFKSEDIYGSDPLRLGVDIDFPLEVDAANLSLKDTIVFDGLGYDITQIQRMLLHYNLVNGFPLGTEFNLVLHDSLNPMENLDTLQFVGINNSQDNIIDAAEVDEDGKVTADVVTSGVLTLSDSEITHLLNTNKIIVDITLSSSEAQGSDSTYVKIYSDNRCLLKVGVETQINID